MKIISLKKLNFISRIFFLTFLVFLCIFTQSKNSAYASCEESPYTIFSDCNIFEFDCLNVVDSTTGNNCGYCTSLYPNTCCEVRDSGQQQYITFCFAPINQPTPTPITSCGKRGIRCCSPPNLCEEELIPQDPDPSPGGENCFCIGATPIPTSKPNPTGIPNYLPVNKEKIYCDNKGYPSSDPATGKIYSALGCVPINSMNEFIGWFLPKILAVMGGAAFLLLAYGVFLITTSSGDPKKVQAGSELITSTLAGLLFIILSLFLLKLIGVDILKIPGF